MIVWGLRVLESLQIQDDLKVQDIDNRQAIILIVLVGLPNPLL